MRYIRMPVSHTGLPTQRCVAAARALLICDSGGPMRLGVLLRRHARRRHARGCPVPGYQHADLQDLFPETRFMTNRDDIAAMCKQVNITISETELITLLSWFERVDEKIDDEDEGLYERLRQQWEALV
jgi:hypothetical protein